MDGLCYLFNICDYTCSYIYELFYIHSIHRNWKQKTTIYIHGPSKKTAVDIDQNSVYH